MNLFYNLSTGIMNLKKAKTICYKLCVLKVFKSLVATVLLVSRANLLRATESISKKRCTLYRDIFKNRMKLTFYEQLQI